MDHVYEAYQNSYQKQNSILTFDQYLHLAKLNPRAHTRHAAQYLLDVFQYFGTKDHVWSSLVKEKRFMLFDQCTEHTKGVVGGEIVHKNILDILSSFVRVGYANKLILLHGPNGSSKSSTMDAIATGLQSYSQTEEGSVYRFNWIFPSDRQWTTQVAGKNHSIGFTKEGWTSDHTSFAFLEEQKIASRIPSDFKENPLFLIPMPYRKELLGQWLGDDQHIPHHMLSSSLSKRNQQIFECLLHGYHGDLKQVFRHIQVERFFYSKPYRVGISTVEAQMSVDALEKQLTMDKNYTTLPQILQTMNFYHSSGHLVEANRGVLEFSDLLKRPVETFKYLLSTIEKSSVNLPSGIAQLDMVYFATTNEKHLDAFKTIPDFSSFKGRFELIRVPYLLLPDLEAQIYQQDVKAIEGFKFLAPHALDILCQWACMTRLKEPNPEFYPKEHQKLIQRVSPKIKLLIYQKKSLPPDFTVQEQHILHDMRDLFWHECDGLSIYEGRFGASPREIRMVFHKTVQNPLISSITALDILNNLKVLVKDKTVYDFLQYEPRGLYHDAQSFISILEKDFLEIFYQEVVDAMSMAEEKEYHVLLNRYINEVVESIKQKDKTSYQESHVIKDVENILGIEHALHREHRQNILSRIAAFKIENPEKKVLLTDLFQEFLEKIKSHFYKEKSKHIEDFIKKMIDWQNSPHMSEELVKNIRNTFNKLEKKYGYNMDSSIRCLQAILSDFKG